MNINQCLMLNILQISAFSLLQVIKISLNLVIIEYRKMKMTAVKFLPIILL